MVRPGTSTAASPTRRVLASLFALAALAVAGGLVFGYTAGTAPLAGGSATVGPEAAASGPTVEQAAGPDSPDAYENATVVTTSERTEGGSRANFVAAYAPDGSVLYRNDSWRVYNDVDPVPGEAATVEYVAADRLSPEECDAEVACWRNVYERVNMSTGEVTREYTYLTSVERGQLHDMDRVADDRLLVGDIARDRVFVVNTTTGIIEWEWQAQSDFDFASGGPFSRDWTHLNDVEMLDDGRVMVSLRNQDQVVFLDPETGVVDDWTLGSDGDHDTIYEQHNPDYIPGERGGPAVLLADSENDRVVEFWRENENESEGGEWTEVWSWSDDRLDWPRDADRLPNDHTLVTDTDGGRVLEVAPNGSVVWRVEVEGGYDAERLGTGDESANGTSAAAWDGNATGE
ncbi:aryl-sulfate sulfotransferase [Halorussus salilacus]|uniref:arylsulfotransferase family protein n=1 Tax=Halorussus salilacus TaxID=2953750 RepID=UPI0020A1A084|nr:arylsulfotransferase family protein [Halorussus salilacus]USZ69473.1 aryl-sulfate sulfotransferase [Halorussus salilacus]